MYPYDFKYRQTIQSNVPGVNCDRGFIAHLEVSAADAVPADGDGVTVTNLGGEIQNKTTGITNPAIPRALSIAANVSGITGNVVLTGKNYLDENITETIILNGTTTVHGNKAFKNLTSIVFPVQVHSPVSQVETATVAGTVTTAGNAKVVVTSTLFEEDVTVDVPVGLGDEAAEIADAIRTALATNSEIVEHFTILGESASVVLTAIPAVNDSTLNIAISDGEGEGASEGVTTAASSANTTAGVPYDIVSVGWNDKLGLPYLLSHNTVLKTYLDNTLEGTAPNVETSLSSIESNTVDLNSALNGTKVDLYLLV